MLVAVFVVANHESYSSHYTYYLLIILFVGSLLG
jgi:hypothetical protein